MARRFGTRENLLLGYNPDRQRDFCAQPARCVTGHAPTLADANLAFGSNTAVAWLVAQLQDLSEFCGCRDKLNARQLESLARLLATAYPWLKLTEVMLFLHRFKLGRYGKFYGAVDPLAITVSLRTFLDERAAIMDEAERRRNDAEREEERQGCVSYEQWRAMRAGKEAET